MLAQLSPAGQQIMAQEIRYNTLKLVLCIIVMAALMPLAAAMLDHGRAKAQFAGWALLVCAPVFMLLCIKWLASTKPPIAFDNQQLVVATNWRRHVMRWSDVVEIKLGSLTDYGFPGLAKANTQHDLYVTVRKGSTGAKRLRVPLAFLRLPNGVDGLLSDLDRASQGALPTASALTPRRPDPNSGNF
jgi:hypothetical protein